MAWTFADSFDLYAAAADLIAGYWDSSSGTLSLVAGRFTPSHALAPSIGSTLTKSSSANDAVHHIVCSFEQTSAITGSTPGLFFTLFDGTTAQCSIVLRTDGAILLTSGGPTGTVLDTWTGAFTGASLWYGFEFEVVISNTAGSWAIRRGGNTVNDHAATGLNTRPTSTNNYANKLQTGAVGGGTNSHVCDDLFWQSGASAGNWLGDIRCYTRMPITDASVQFSQSGPLPAQVITPAALSNSFGASAAKAAPFVSNYTGTLSGGLFSTGAASTGNCKFALYDHTGAVLLATSNAVTNPPAGLAATAIPFTFPSPVTLTKGQTYYLAVDQDSTINYYISSLTGTVGATLAYASFPPSSIAAWTTTGNFITASVLFTSPANASFVGEAQQDGATTYLFDSNPGDADFYNIATIPVTPANIIATVVRGYMMKSDTGSRTGAVQLRSGSATVASPTLTLTNSSWNWTWRIDLTDPNTGAAWTPSAVNSALIGPTVVA